MGFLLCNIMFHYSRRYEMNVRQAIGQEILSPTASTGISSQLLRPRSFTGVAGAGAATTITLAANTGLGTAIEGMYDGWNIRIIFGTGIGQERRVTSYVGSTRVATVPTWQTNPDNTSSYIVVPPLDGLAAKCARISVEAAEINYCVNGSVPTAVAGTNIGTYADVTKDIPIELNDPNDVRNFLCIPRVSGNGAKVKVVTFA
jgi:hypothetical protein